MLNLTDIGWSADELGHEFVFGVNGDVVFVAVDRPFSFFGEGGVGIVFSGASCGLDQAGIAVEFS